jgi:hypothetical protein
MEKEEMEMGKVKSLMMDYEDQFVEAVSARIGECETVDELNMKLIEDRAFVNIMYMSGPEQDEWVDELWGEFWSNHQ